MAEFSHLDAEGRARMVDVGEKPVTARRATAAASVRLSEAAFAALRDGSSPKGDVLAAARLAGIQAAKRTAGLIPLCHPVPLDAVEVSLSLEAPSRVAIEATARARWTTGVEMEALVAVSVAALTVYDMCKALDRGIVIESVLLLHKSGGRSGEYRRGGAGER